LIDGYAKDVVIGRTTRFNLTRIRERMGTISVARLGAADIASFVAERRKEGAGGVTVAADLSALSAVLKWARRVRSIDVNDRLANEARSGLTAARISTRSRERTRVPLRKELDAILGHLERNPRQVLPVAAITRFAAVSAMRLSEITGIRIEDISWNEKAVLVRERKDPQRKAERDEMVPLVNGAYEMLREAVGDRRSGRVWPFNSRSVGTAFRRAARAVKVKDLHFHDLRHLAITELFRRGLPIQLVAVVSGHRDWKHLKRYTRLDASDVHAALDKVR
jgi:integrase